MDKLQTLIEELEREKEALQRLINEAVKEQEFLNAHFHSEALEQVNNRLQILGGLDDDLYGRKLLLATGIENLKKLFNQEQTEEFKAMISKRISENEKELAELKQIPKQQKPENYKSHLQDNLEQFAKSKIRGIRVMISQTHNISIEIRKTKEGTKLTISDLKSLETNDMLSEEEFLKLKALGFSRNKRGNKATTILKVKKDEVATTVVKLISIIFFELFYFIGSKENATIEILNRHIRGR